MSSLHELAGEVATARKSFIASASGLTHPQGSYKPSADEWSIVDNVEHLVWAEMGGINGMWKALLAYKTGTPMFTGEAIHKGLAIEAIIEKTWKPREQVPEVAKPRWGGPLQYWIEALDNCQSLLLQLADNMEGVDPQQVIYPHPISGPLNVVQRFQFLRFHLNRHKAQIGRIKASPGYVFI